MANTSTVSVPLRQLPNDLRVALGCRVLARRRLLRWSQRLLAETTGLLAVRISKIENGHISPSLAEAVRLAQGLEISLDELVLGTGAVEEAKPKTRTAATDLRGKAGALAAIGSRETLEVVAELLGKLIADRQAARTKEPG